MSAPDQHTTPLEEMYAALYWLGQLLSFRLQAQADAAGATPQELTGNKPLMQLYELLEEFSRFTGQPLELDEGPPPIPPGGWLSAFSARFRLNPLESLLLVAAMAPTFDGRFAAAFGQAQGTNRPERATADLVGRLLALSLPERARLAAFVQPGGRLEQLGLLHLDWTETAAFPPNLQPLDVPDRLRWYFLDRSDFPPAQLRRYLRVIRPRYGLADVPLEAEVVQKLGYIHHQLRGAMDREEVLPLVVLEGPPGAGQLEAAEAVARELGLGVLEIDLNAFLAGQEGSSLITHARREGLLQNAAVILKIHWTEQLTPALQRRLQFLLDDELRLFSRPVFTTGNLSVLAKLGELTRPALRLELRLPGREVQRQVIGLVLDQQRMRVTPEAIEELLNRYNVDHQVCEEVVRTARALAHSNRPADGTLQGSELEAGIELILSRNLGSLSNRLTARNTWDDLILPEEIIGQLKTLRNLIEYRHVVFDEWGLGHKISSGKGIKALFSGPSGTGKTMAAEVIASELRMPLYRVDLSQVVSKWVGETEKNLEKIFAEAQSSQAILLFDEADALFGKRGKVENANDRHSNLEVSFLLQRFEIHDGVVILTSNFPTVIDTAFSRRMHFMIDFPAPDEQARTRLWKKLLIPTLPMGPDVDLRFLAQRFELSGANIRNVIMGAAFMAAAEGGVVGMSQIARALSWECVKLGRTVSASDFGRYFKYLDATSDSN